MTEQENIIELEAKVQTIYYEDVTGKLGRFYHVGQERINIKQAEQILVDNEINVQLVLRTLTEKINVGLTKEELQERITTSESYYQRRN